MRGGSPSRRLSAGLLVLLALCLALWALWAGRSPPAGRAPRADQWLVTLRPELPPRPEAPDGAPHLVLVIGCTVRKDQTSLYGGPAETTPFLSRLASRGARLDDLVTAAPWTRAASTAILTGHHPLAVGMADPSPGSDERSLPQELVTLAEHLRGQGYQTLGLTTNPNLNSFFGFDQGFDAYRQLARLWREDGVKLSGRVAVDEMLSLLDQHRADQAQGGPLYLQLVLIDAHAPHSASEAERARFADPSVPARVVAYRAALSRFDAAVQRLHEGLAARGLDEDNTIFAVINDHGEGLSFPAHHGASHGRYLAPSSVGGVFVASGPGLASGHAVSGLASQVDLAQTLSALLGLPPFPGDGLDLSASLRGQSEQTGRDRAFADTWFKETSRSAIYTDTTACQRDFAPAGDSSFVDGCFDRRSDPEHAHPGQEAALEAVLEAWREEKLQQGRVFAWERATPDAGTNEQLEALGYLD